MSRDSIEIDISDPQEHIHISSESLYAVIRRALARQAVSQARLSVALVDDAHIRELNRQFLSHDYATDVLSFRLSDPGDALFGEVVVSAETARRVAAERRLPPEAELLLYVVHGVLHLVGYDDVEPADAERMHRLEEEVLAEFGFENVYWPERAGDSSRAG